MSFSIIALVLKNKEFQQKSIKGIDSNVVVEDTAKSIKTLVGGSGSTIAGAVSRAMDANHCVHCNEYLLIAKAYTIRQEGKAIYAQCSVVGLYVDAGDRKVNSQIVALTDAMMPRQVGCIGDADFIAIIGGFTGRIRNANILVLS